MVKIGLYKHIREIWKKPSKELLRSRLIKWRKDQVCVRIERPERIDRAHSLGYKAKKGYIMIRTRVPVSRRMRPRLKSGRRTKTQRRKKIVGKNYQWIAEERTQKRYPNLVVLNSYFLAKDGKNKWYDIIMLDPDIVKNYKGMEWIAKGKNRDRVWKGKTSAGSKSRGLRNKGIGAEKLRPSLGAHGKRGKN